MTVKQLLNFIAIEVEAGRLSEDAEINVYATISGEHIKITSAETYADELDLNIEI